MFHKSEIVLMEKTFSVMSNVNDIYILRKSLGQRIPSPHPDHFLAMKITFTYIYLLLDKI